MKQHAAFSPSASDRWLNCPASHLRSAALPPAPSSTYADRGTLLHEYAAIAVLGTMREMDKKARDNGVTFETDEREAILVYVNFYDTFRHHLWAQYLRDVCIWATVVITLSSGFLYIQRAVSLYRENRVT